MKNVIIMAFVLFGLTVSAESNAAYVGMDHSNNKVYCVDCGSTGKEMLPVANTTNGLFYNQIIESPKYSFIREDLGTSCYAGGWYAINKSSSNPTAKKIPVGCEEISDIHAEYAKGITFLKIQYYSGKTKTYEFK